MSVYGHQITLLIMGFLSVTNRLKTSAVLQCVQYYSVFVCLYVFLVFMSVWVVDSGPYKPTKYACLKLVFFSFIFNAAKFYWPHRRWGWGRRCGWSPRRERWCRWRQGGSQRTSLFRRSRTPAVLSPAHVRTSENKKCNKFEATKNRSFQLWNLQIFLDFFSNYRVKQNPCKSLG